MPQESTLSAITAVPAVFDFSAIKITIHKLKLILLSSFFFFFPQNLPILCSSNKQKLHFLFVKKRKKKNIISNGSRKWEGKMRETEKQENRVSKLIVSSLSGFRWKMKKEKEGLPRQFLVFFPFPIFKNYIEISRTR